MNSERGALQIIKGSMLIDGKGDHPIEQGAVLIEGTHIIQVGIARQITIPEGAKVVEHSFPECSILPGLVDTHNHLNMPGDGRGILEVMAEPDEILLLRSAQNARIALQSGVTTMRDNGGRNKTTFYLRESISTDMTVGPRLNLCGWPITITGGHCFPMGGEADGIDGVRKAVRQVIKAGADYIKVMASGGETPNTFPLLPSYTLEELRVLVDESHRFSKLTAAHCTCTSAVVNALEAGIDMLIHCPLRESDGSWKPQPDIIERIAKAGVWVNPTLHSPRSRYLALCNRQEKEGPNPELDVEIAELKQRLENKNENVRQMRNAGVKLVAGSDNGWGYSRFGEFVYEIEAMHRAGLSPMEVILSATHYAADSLGFGDIVGTLEPRKEADILVVEGDPFKDIMDLMNVKAVFKAGDRIR